MSLKTITVSIIEDSTQVRESLTHLVNGAAGMRCISAFPSAEEALENIPKQKPDVVLMDIHLGGISGIECTRRLKSKDPERLVMMLTAYQDDELIFQALKAGANGYLLKQTPPAEVLAAIHEVHQGGAPMSGNIARKVIRSFHESEQSGSDTDRLTLREREILDLLAKGYHYKEISDLLVISYATVNSHVKSIYSKLHVTSRIEAVSKFLNA
jgi:DNA-binding NarL/FixJ family response regulator